MVRVDASTQEAPGSPSCRSHRCDVDRCGAIAFAVYEWIGLPFLRRGWINLDLLWVVALLGAGVYLLVTALWH